MSIAHGEPTATKTLAQKLDRLFQTVRARDQVEYTYKEVADAIAAQGGPTISATYLWELRTGRKDNPTRKHLEALAQFFHVSPAYFLDEEVAARIDAELAFLGALRDASIRHMALRAAGLSPTSVRAITEMIEHVRQLEGLPNSGPGEQPFEETTDT